MSAMTLSTAGFIITGVLLNAVAQLLLKMGVTPLGPLSVGWDNALPIAGRVLSQWPVLGGLACYVASVGVWIVGLSRVDVSVAYPMLSLGYVVNAIAAWWLLGEAIGPMRVAGMLLILGGVWLVARS
jgi:multidrug transporter EmrE-like cation transporter